MFDVTGEMIGKLRDDDLRSLVGLLCETEYRMEGLPTRGIMWGGNQDAKDGGLDVVVKDTVDPPKNSWILRPYTGFQVKKPSMPPTKITSEMKPKGQLRDVIKELIRNKGAYILISSEDSCTNEFLQLRLDKMKEAIADVPNSEQLHIDFLDSDRLATWVRTYPSLILWVKEKIGTATYGWKPFGNWSLPPNNSEDSYLHNDVPIFSLRIGNQMQHLTAVQTIAHLRTELSNKNAFIRLVGLSGVGKTRFVTALFDKTIGENPLNTGAVFYTDLSEETIPSPTQLADQLIINKQDIILIIDNCPPNVHKQIVEKCRAMNCAIKLLSIEYDVRDDLPEETDVIIMEPSGQSLIQELIRKRHPHISIVDAETISEFSGGNYRIAIALANTINRGDSIGHLRDEELFQRLFHQKNEKDGNLLRIASVLSLVYSFEKNETDDSELHILAGIANVSFSEIYRCVGVLESRNLIQSRGHWRAVLPQAIANRLAKQALNDLPTNQILEHLINANRERLFLSFTRRLGYLHDVEKAQKIVSDWLKPDGMLGKTNGNLSPLQKQVLSNIAPVAPEIILSVIEGWVVNTEHFDEVSNSYDRFVDILRDIAFEENTFLQSTQLMCKIVCKENLKKTFSIRYIQSLFTLHLSGTLAKADVRIELIKWLWNEGTDQSSDLAILILGQTYVAREFTAFRNYSFGAQKRNYGWEPQTQDDIDSWYETFLDLGYILASSGKSNSDKVKYLLANNLRDLWTCTTRQKTLTKIFKALAKDTVWAAGWASVRETIKFDSNELSKSSLMALIKLEKELAPKTLLEKVQVYVLSDHVASNVIESLEDDENQGENYNRICLRLGREVIKDDKIFVSLLPTILTQNSIGMLYFGMGLAEEVTDKVKLWQEIEKVSKTLPLNELKLQCLVGILSSQNMDSVLDQILDSILNDNQLNSLFVHLQLSLNVDHKATNRLQIAIQQDLTNIHEYTPLGFLKHYPAINVEGFAMCLIEIMKKKDGVMVAFSIFSSHQLLKQYQYSDVITSLMQEVLIRYPYRDTMYDNNDSRLARIAETCLSKSKTDDIACQICNTIAKIVMKKDYFLDFYNHLLSTVAKFHPRTFLNSFFSNPNIEIISDGNYRAVLRDAITPLHEIKDKVIIQWCEEDPLRRFLLITSAISIYSKTPKEEIADYKPIIYTILDVAPNTHDILKAIARTIIPTSWSNSKAVIITRRAEALKHLFENKNDVIAIWAKKTYGDMTNIAKQEKQREQERDRLMQERFE